MNTTAAKNRRIRIALLELLRTEYPGAIDTRALRFAMDNLGYPMPEGMLEAHLRYLDQKGYAAYEMKSGAGYRIEFAALTAHGWDLLDGLVEGERGVDTEL